MSGNEYFRGEEFIQIGLLELILEAFFHYVGECRVNPADLIVTMGFTPFGPLIIRLEYLELRLLKLIVALIDVVTLKHSDVLCCFQEMSTQAGLHVPELGFGWRELFFLEDAEGQ